MSRMGRPRPVTAPSVKPVQSVAKNLQSRNLKTTITGSLPKPTWLAPPGAHLIREWEIPSDHLAEAQDDAVRLAIADQEHAGIDIVTDGEQRRRHYIWGFVEGLTGIDTQILGKKKTRG